MSKKPYEALRIEPISCFLGTRAGGGAEGSTIGGGAVDVSGGIGDFSILVGARAVFGTAATWNGNGSAVNNIVFSVYEATAATHAGSAITGATLSLGAATAGTLRGLYDAIIQISSGVATTVNITINGISYHCTALHAGAGSAAAIELANHINGVTTHASRKLPHYKAETSTAGVFITTGAIYVHPEDDQATGLTIVMDAVTDSVVPYWNKVQGKIDINAHALSTNTPKWLSVRNTTFAGASAVTYSFLLRHGGPTPGRLTAINT